MKNKTIAIICFIISVCALFEIAINSDTLIAETSKGELIFMTILLTSVACIFINIFSKWDRK